MFLEEYFAHDTKRYRFRIEGTNVVLNVSAQSLEEAERKARELLRKHKITDENIKP